MPLKKPTTLRILCFGDSLTQGFHSFGLGEHPYSGRLAQRLREALPEGIKLEMRTSGVPGDVAAFPSFRERFTRQITLMPFDWVITLGGTNDIAMGCRVDDTFKSLQAAWQIALSRRCNVLALTVPETAGNFSSVTAKRKDLNTRILSFKAENYHTLDLHQKIPYNSLNDSQRDLYWNDGVHLTEQGYDWMADHIADALIPLVLGDMARLDEEEEHPKGITRGYVAVRKSDLD
ncbi:GDSL-like Lipase/Acylhydrolase [Beauveria bassiana ARSEF 2860]|uniref:GDSL-like Lipase/Acylhydrolase n=1 Tax=Beauveria bassiana (strain ARSEF 2860) TaxID=655819 RepID=J4UX24_BEAB2|nr:GDSL-like Lipase/Acylhydrolase [Beauveria bassiana ARSEF 2860]EJP70952.1 GDSL-like Lipase/Acylhydrolase [Beauveria bassiana ARSEF 2860]